MGCNQGLSILGAQPERNNAMFEKIASTPSLWEPTVHGLLHADDAQPPDNITSGCHEGYACVSAATVGLRPLPRL